MKKSLFKTALDSLETQEKTTQVIAPSQQEVREIGQDDLVTSGPLASAFTKALNEKFNKDAISAESQQTDLYQRFITRTEEEKRQEEQVEQQVTYQPVTSTGITADMTQEDVVRFFNSNDFTDTNITPVVEFVDAAPDSAGNAVPSQKLMVLTDPQTANSYVVESVHIVIKKRKVDFI